MIELTNVLEKSIYNKCHGLLKDTYHYVNDCSLQKNLDLWAKNKEGLYNILKKSEYWNENELCLVIDTKIYRKLNYALFCNMIQAISRNHQILEDDYKQKIVEGITVITSCIRNKEFNGFIKQEELDAIKQNYKYHYSADITDDEILKNFSEKKYHSDYHGNVGIAYALTLKYKIRSGQKWCKVLNKIFIGEGINIGKTDLYHCKEYEEIKGVRDYINKDASNWYIDYYYNYDQFFAVLSDILTPNEYEERLYISINPIDYLTQSHGDNWTSCHSLKNKGCYHSATFTMLTDSTSLIAYTLPKKYENDFSLQPKKTRQSLFIGDNKNSIFQNSFYPGKEMNESRKVREILEELLANYNSLPNNWVKVNNCNDLDTTEYLGYKDWENGQAYACVHLKDSQSSYEITLGHYAYTIDNSNEYVYETETLEGDGSICYHCDNHGDLTWIEYYDRYVCDNCLEEYYAWCEDISEYRLLEDAYYLEDCQYYVSESGNYYWCEETSCYYSEATYVEDYGYVNKESIENPNKYFQNSDGLWYRVCDLAQERIGEINVE